MKTPSILYKQSHQPILVEDLRGLQWFALTPEYGESYGNIHTSFRIKRKPKLLDIGNAKIRNMIRRTISTKNPDIEKTIEKYSDPNEQYSGGVSNRKYHEIVKSYFGDKYDGTIINEKHLKGNKEYSKEDLEGPSELVLWKHFTTILEEIPEEREAKKAGGKRTRKIRTKLRKKDKATMKRKSKYLN